MIITAYRKRKTNEEKQNWNKSVIKKTINNRKATKAIIIIIIILNKIEIWDIRIKKNRKVKEDVNEETKNKYFTRKGNEY